MSWFNAKIIPCFTAVLFSIFALPFVSLPAFLWGTHVQAANEDQSPIVISTGVEGGSLALTGKRLQLVAGEMGLAIETLGSEGSIENLDRLLNPDSPVNLAFARADALQYHLNRYPSDRVKLEILEKIGQQCVFVATGLHSEIDDGDDLQDFDNLRLGIDSTATDIAVSFDYMASRIPELEDVNVVYGDFPTLARQLLLNKAKKKKKDAKLDAILLFSAPRVHAEQFQYILDNPHRYKIIDFEDDRLTEAQPDGRRIYRSVRLAVPGAERPIRTLCVRGLLLANRQKLSPRHRNRLTDLVSYYWMRVYSSSRSSE